MNSEAGITARVLIKMGRESKPFRLMLDDQDAEAALLECSETVRSIPGKRMVCRGSWQGRDVFIKLYFHARKDWEKELRGLDAMHASSIDAPVVICSGTADQGAIDVIVLEAIQPAETFEAAWRKAGTEVARLGLLEKAVTTIAAHHMNGFAQQDIHLDNFLLADDRLYTLDGGGIYLFGHGELPLKRSLDNLALFFAQFYPDNDRLIDRVFEVYRQCRLWDAGSQQGKQLQRRVRYFRRRRQGSFLKKIFRECSAFVCDHDWKYYCVYDRSLASREMVEFLANPDASFQDESAELLKDGNTCTLWLTSVDQRLLVVKRYNIKGPGHRIGRAFRRTRAAVSWKNAHRLGMYGIPTAHPVALVEERMGPLRGRAWFVSEYVQGSNALSLCEDPEVNAISTLSSAQAIVTMLGQLADSRISHGDMKGTNFILSAQGPVIIDLDSMEEHAARLFFHRKQRRDMHRFLRNWDNCPGVKTMFHKLMHEKDLVTD